MDNIIAFGFLFAFLMTLIFIYSFVSFLMRLSKDAHSVLSDRFESTAQFVALWPIPSLLLNIFSGYIIISHTDFHSTDTANIVLSVAMLISLIATYSLSLAYIRNHPDEIEAYKKDMKRRDNGY